MRIPLTMPMLALVTALAGCSRDGSGASLAGPRTDGTVAATEDRTLAVDAGGAWSADAAGSRPPQDLDADAGTVADVDSGAQPNETGAGDAAVLGDAGGQATATVRDLVQEADVHAELTCRCYELSSHASESECLDDQLTFGPEVTRCAEAAFAMDAQGARPWLSCYVPAMQAFSECMRQQRDCSSATGESRFECSNPLQAAVAECPQLPLPVAEALTECRLFE